MNVNNEKHSSPENYADKVGHDTTNYGTTFITDGYVRYMTLIKNVFEKYNQYVHFEIMKSLLTKSNSKYLQIINPKLFNMMNRRPIKLVYVSLKFQDNSVAWTNHHCSS